ncbi:MAG: hypothetical protein LBF68_05975 [Christensenellaceae bacterium]|jgi:transcriptional regulator with XRE-family HTH domain|nr:hypothetical protein [Christensenellaceae bacterium]
MAKIKTEKEVCEYLVKLTKERGLSRADLVDYIAKQRGTSHANRESIKNDIAKQVSNWFDKKDRYPSTQYIYYLATALGVTIEHLLLCEEINESLNDEQSPTLASIAKITDPEQVKKAINNIQEWYGNRFKGFANLIDEYGMNLLDYIIKFENIIPLKHLIDENLISIFPKHSDITLLNSSDKLLAILKLLAKKDDIDAFEKLTGKHLIFTQEVKSDVGYLQIDDELIPIMSKSPQFLRHFSLAYFPSHSEFEEINQDINLNDYENLNLYNLKRLHGGFEEMLNYLVQTDPDNGKYYLKIAINQAKYLGYNMKDILNGVRLANDDESLEIYTKRLITLPILDTVYIKPQLKSLVRILNDIVKTILSGKQPEEQEKRYYYIVTVKCGHVGRNHYKEAKLPIRAISATAAASIARSYKRVKHNHADAIISTVQVSRDVFLAQKEENENDPYFKCVTKSDQKKIVNLTNIKDDLHMRRMKYKKHEFLDKSLYHKKTRAKTFNFIKKNAIE